MVVTAKDLRKDYPLGFHDVDISVFRSAKGLSPEVVAAISADKQEPAWMLKYRLKALDHFLARPMPTWGPDLSQLDFDEIYYYVKPVEAQSRTWEDVPESIKRTFEKIGVPEAERKFLGGVSNQYDSNVVYHSIREDLEKQGVLFSDCDTGLREHPDIFRKYFGTIIPSNDNKFAALNSACWSGGSFVYIPPGVHVEVPLQAYFRINSDSMGQFERTLIIADEGSSVHYVEGCSAGMYSADALHSAVVELVALPGSKIRYTTIQNWSDNVYNLVTKRAAAYAGSTVEWVDCNLGCLAEGSRVATKSGPKPIEALSIGDKVLAFDESSGRLCYRRVLAKRFSGNQPVQAVSYANRLLKTTAEHPFYSYRYDPTRAKKLGRYQFAYVPANQVTQAIIPRDSLESGTPHHLRLADLSTTFDTYNQYARKLSGTRTRTTRLAAISQTTDDLMWLFGYWVGDGNLQMKQGKTPGVIRYASVGFSTPSADRAHPRLIRTMAALLDNPPLVRDDDHHVQWCSVELAALLQLNGFVGKARTKRVPQWVWTLPESQRLAFIAGYLDADGFGRNGRLQLKSVNLPLLEDISSLLLNLGITARRHTEYTEPRNSQILGRNCILHGSHTLTFEADSRLLPHLSESLRAATLKGRRKAILRRQVGRSTLIMPPELEIVKVTRSPLDEIPVPTWDIEVEGDGNFVAEGFIVHNSKLTMKYPSIYLLGEHAHAEIISAAFAGDGQHQDAGGKAIHVASNTTSNIVSRSISKGTGHSTYRGHIKVLEKARNVKINVRCDALLLDAESRSDTYPYMDVESPDVEIGHEASVSKVGEDQLFYLRARGLSESEATAMIVNGFFEPMVRELPMEYAVELNRILALSMEGAIG